MHRAACPGSFDPLTNGHIDVIGRAAALFDEVVVAVGVNQAKARMFSAQERVEMITEACAGIDNLRVGSFEGLLTDFCRDNGLDVIVKGLRAGGDFDYELQMAQMNARLTGIETVFVPAAPDHAFVASSLVKEVASFGGDVSGFVPPIVLRRLERRLGAADG